MIFICFSGRIVQQLSVNIVQKYLSAQTIEKYPQLVFCGGVQVTLVVPVELFCSKMRFGKDKSE